MPTGTLGAMLQTYAHEGDLIETGSHATDAYSTTDPSTRAAARTRVDELLDRLPPDDAWMVREHHLAGRSQSDIARELGIGQPSVWHRARRAMSRLRVVATWPGTPEQIAATLAGVIDWGPHSDPAVCEAIITAYMRTWSQGRCGVPQSVAWRRLEQVRELTGHRDPEVRAAVRAVESVRSYQCHRRRKVG